jgi:hypothetical protein
MENTIKKSEKSIENDGGTSSEYRNMPESERNELLHNLCAPCAGKEYCGINSDTEMCDEFENILNAYNNKK